VTEFYKMSRKSHRAEDRKGVSIEIIDFLIFTILESTLHND